MDQDIHILRLGYYDHANLLPLLYPLQAGWTAPASPWKLEMVRATPGGLCEQALAGELDAAFLPPLFVADNGSQLSAQGGWGLACEGRVLTAQLLAPQRLDQMDGQDVSVSPEAAGSTAEHLLRLLLKPYYDITLSLKSPGDGGYDEKGARLRYGDNAARDAAARLEGWVADDLGVAWYVLSGLPMVWCVMAGPRDLESRKPGAGEQLQVALRASQRTAQEQQSTILELGAERLGIDRAALKEQFARQKFVLGETEQKGLARFLDLASRAGLLKK